MENNKTENLEQQSNKSPKEAKSNGNDWSKREIGALWKRKSPTQYYLSGHLTLDFDKKYKVMVFANRHKKADTHPDYRVYLQDDSGKVTKVAAAPVEKEEIL